MKIMKKRRRNNVRRSKNNVAVDDADPEQLDNAHDKARDKGWEAASRGPMRVAPSGFTLIFPYVPVVRSPAARQARSRSARVHSGCSSCRL